MRDILISIIAGSVLALSITIPAGLNDITEELDQITKIQIKELDDEKLEPYGGCKEAALYEGTPGYRWCEKRGLLP